MVKEGHGVHRRVNQAKNVKNVAPRHRLGEQRSRSVLWKIQERTPKLMLVPMRGEGRLERKK